MLFVLLFVVVNSLNRWSRFICVAVLFGPGLVGCLLQFVKLVGCLARFVQSLRCWFLSFVGPYCLLCCWLLLIVPVVVFFVNLRCL